MSRSATTAPADAAGGRTGGRQQLFLLPLHRSLPSADAIGVLDRLATEGAVEVTAAVLLERCDDASTWHAAAGDGPMAGRQLAPGAWAWLIAQAFAPGNGPGSSAEPGRGRGDPGLSESFVAEVTAVSATADGWLAAVVSHLDARAAVSALRRYPATRLMYGDLPPWMVERILTWPT